MLAALLLLLAPAPATPHLVPAPPPLGQASARAAEQAQETALGRLRSARAELIEEVADLAARADELGYFSSARELHGLHLTLDPSSEAARLGLGMRRRGGEWVPSSRKPPRDRVDAEEREAFERVRADVLARALERVAAAFGGTELSPLLREERRRALEELLALGPDDSDLREAAGFAWDAERERWDLREVVSARRARIASAELLERIRAELPEPGAAELEQRARAVGVELPVVIGSEELTVATTETEAEAERLHELVLTERRFLEASFGEELLYPVPVSVLSIPDGAVKRRYLENHPLVGPERLAEHESLYGSWVLRHMLLSAPSIEERLDMGTFLTAATYLELEFGERGDAGWVRQSLSSYLAAEVCGTHISFLVARGSYGEQQSIPWPDRVPPTLDDWLRAARPLLVPEHPLPRFARALTTPTHAMTWEDVLVGYAFGAYLFEGRRVDLDELLRRIGRGEEKVGAIEDTLDMPLPAVRTRLAAWIDGLQADD